MKSGQSEKVEILITPARGYPKINFQELIAARFLLWNLIKRNVITSYVEHRYGVFWTLFKPVLFVLVAIFIKHASQAKLQEGLEYVPFVYTGLALWWYFADATSSAARSIYKDRGLITKVYYPRIMSPIAPIIALSVDLLIRLSIVPFAMFYYSYFPDLSLIFLPIIILNVMFLSLGIGLIVAAISTFFRDVEKILAHLIYLGLFLSPVLYSVDMIPQQYRQLYLLINPMAVPLENFRYALFSNSPIQYTHLSISCLLAGIIFLVGFFFFSKVEANLADKVL